MIDRDRAIKLLGSGVQAEMVAATLGCDASYISQLLSEDDFREQVVQLRVKSLTKASERDETADELEDQLLGKLKDSMDYIHKPRDILQAYSVLNKAVRRGAGAQQTNLINNVVVNLTLPTVIQQKFAVNSNNEVIEVDGKTQITMSPATLLKNLANERGVHDELKAQELRALAGRLPSEVLARSQGR